MSWISRLRGFFGRRVDQDLDAELQSHIEMRAEMNERAGMSQEEARRDALRRFGNRAIIKEDTRRFEIVPWMEAVAQDVRYAARVLRKRAGFTIAAVLTLAVGIGANAAIFSLVDAYLLRPLPYRDPNRLVDLWESTREGGRGGVAMANYQDWLRQSTAFEALGAWTPSHLNFNLGSGTERIAAEFVTPNLFSLLGTTPTLGRAFGAEEETPRPVAIVSTAFWRDRLGGDPDVLDRALNLNGAVFTVVGVAPPGFTGLSGQAEIWVPISAYHLLNSQLAALDFPHSRDVHFMRGIGRLKPGISVEAATAEMKMIGDRLAIQFPNENRERSVALAPAQADMVRDVRGSLWILFAAVGLTLLVACANVANLVMVQLSRRDHEMVVRIALGARSSHLFRQLWSEAALLAAAGTGLGMLLFLVVRTSWNVFVPLNLPKFAEARFDLRLLAFALALMLLTAMVFALLPLWHLRRHGPQPQLASGARSAPSTSPLQRALATSEVALAVVLTIGAGLMIKSLLRLQKADLGFRPDHLLTLRFDVPSGRYSADALASLAERVAEDVRSLPGVESAAGTTSDLFVWPGINRAFSVDGHEKYSNLFNVYHQQVTPGYFHTLGIPLLAGRDFAPTDDARSQRVVIVSRSFAHQYLGDDPIGKRMKYGDDWRLIVGEVDDAQIEDVHRDKADIAIFYSPLRSSQPPETTLTLLVRTRQSPLALLPVLRDELKRFDSGFAVYSDETMGERIAANAATTRSFTTLMAIFGSVALFLALIGTYGVIAFSVSQRTREIGIRMALGAQRADILRLVTASGARAAAIGVAIGLTAALALARFLSTLLFRVDTQDPVVYAVVATMVAIAALVASYVPARRASGIDPANALRHE